MMMGIVAQQPEPHTWRGTEAVAGSGALSSAILFSPFARMVARFSGSGSAILKGTNLRMSATFVGSGQFFLQSINANLLRKGGVGWAGASTMIANGTIV